MRWLRENSFRKWPQKGEIGWIFHHVVMYTRERESEYVIENFITNSIVFKLNFDSTEFYSTMHSFFLLFLKMKRAHTFFDNFLSLFMLTSKWSGATCLLPRQFLRHKKTFAIILLTRCSDLIINDHIPDTV